MDKKKEGNESSKEKRMREKEGKEGERGRANKWRRDGGEKREADRKVR